MNNTKKLKALHSRLMVIGTVKVAQIDNETNAVGLTFDYLGQTYTVYIDGDSERGNLLKHELGNMADIEEIGELSANDLIQFFGSLPHLDSIVK